MKTWFNRNPNVAVVLLGLGVLISMFDGFVSFQHRQWGWLAVNVIAFLSFESSFRRWWKRT